MHLFYEKNISGSYHILNEINSKHCIQVLRMAVGSKLLLCDGDGKAYTCTIHTIGKKTCEVHIESFVFSEQQNKIHLAIAFTKNPSRMEWMLEKITEIGVKEITPILTKRSEKVFDKQERFEKIISSAMCQSQQMYLPVLHKPTNFESILLQSKEEIKLIAHCIDSNTKTSLATIEKQKSTLICIGPEGDFTPEEVSLAKQVGAIEVGLGNTRLRTETAGMVAVSLLNII